MSSKKAPRINLTKKQKELHERGMKEWLEGHKRLNENIRKKIKQQKQRIATAYQRANEFLSKVKQSKGPASKK